MFERLCVPQTGELFEDLVNVDAEFLVAGILLRGRVRDEGGVPIGGARVLFNGQGVPSFHGEAGPDGRVRRLSVKKPISDRPEKDPGVVGAFWFRRAALFMDAANELFTRGLKVNGEYYADSVLGLMAEQGRDTAGLPRNASTTQVRDALAWDGGGWPWADYGPVVMAAVRAGVPVLGGNLPRARMRAAMQDSALDTRLPPAAWAEQRERIREGHCGLLPESQITPMTRVQIARDMAMADTVVRALQPGRTVLLVAGNGHVQRGLGVPLHLPPKIKAKVVSARSEKALPATNNIAATASGHDTDLVWPTAPQPPRDYCAELRRTGGGAPGAPGAPGTPDAPPHPDTLPHQ